MSAYSIGSQSRRYTLLQCALYERIFDYQGKYGDNPGYGPCLYDLENDRAETTNVADKHPETVKELKKILSERLSMDLP